MLIHDGSWRRLLVIVTAGAALIAMGAIFWHQDLRYSLPTTPPPGLVQVPIGAIVALPAPLTTAASGGKPLLLHFYNQDCPCSRFNRDHLRALHRRFGEAVQFVAVVESAGGEATGSGVPMPHVLDRGGALAAAFGVYSTPQAVLLDGERRLRFRGNYNTSRYCTARQTEFVRLALEALLGHRPLARDAEAELAWGCPLPDQECRDGDR